ncbi:MAG: DUF6146 family protein [Bacteroidota bacterium]|nr:DUF6146 family protein [Bacteroidota bacterium]
MNGISKYINNNVLPFVFFMVIAACNVQKPLHKAATPEISPEDSTEYELLVFDSGFETWHLLRNSPTLYHSINYYQNWNRQYVDEWNFKSMYSRYSRFFGSPINYDHHENYPMEIEHKLYYYFQYVEEVLRIPILRRRAR